MALYLIESSLNGIVSAKEELDQKVSELQGKLNENQASLIELQVSKDFHAHSLLLKQKIKKLPLKR